MTSDNIQHFYHAGLIHRGHIIGSYALNTQWCMHICCRICSEPSHVSTLVLEIQIMHRMSSWNIRLLTRIWHLHNHVIKWKHFPRYWPFVRGIHRSPVNSPHKGHWRVALMLSLICARINGWGNNREAGDLRRHRTHYNVILMLLSTRHDYCYMHTTLVVTTNHAALNISNMNININSICFTLPADRNSFTTSYVPIKQAWTRHIHTALVSVGDRKNPPRKQLSVARQWRKVPAHCQFYGVMQAHHLNLRRLRLQIKANASHKFTQYNMGCDAHLSTSAVVS